MPNAEWLRRNRAILVWVDRTDAAAFAAACKKARKTQSSVLRDAIHLMIDHAEPEAETVA